MIPLRHELALPSLDDEPPALVCVSSAECSDEHSVSSSDCSYAPPPRRPASPGMAGLFLNVGFHPLGPKTAHDDDELVAADATPTAVETPPRARESGKASDAEIVDKMWVAAGDWVNRVRSPSAGAASPKGVDEMYEPSSPPPVFRKRATTTEGRRREQITEETWEEERAMMRCAIADLKAANSDRDDAIEFLRAENASLLASKDATEAGLRDELDNRSSIISSLEDALETLRAENLRLRLKCDFEEGLRRAAEEEKDRLRTNVQLHFIENSHYSIL